MRVLFTIWPATAHVYPIVPLAWALQAAGHEVCVASHPAVAPAVNSVGLTAVSLGDESTLPPPLGAGKPPTEETTRVLDRITRALAIDPADEHAWRFHRDYMLPAIRDFSPVDVTAQDPQPLLDELVRFCRSWQPDLVLWDPTMPSSPVAARASGAAHARFLWGLDHFTWARDLYTERAGQPGPPLTDEEPQIASLRPMAERYGFEVDDELLNGQWTVDPMPTAARLPSALRTVPMRWVPYSGADVLPPWLYAKPERPRVALSLGASIRVFSKDSEQLIANLLKALGELDVDVVATLNQAQLEGIDHVPDNVRTVDYVPLAQLLPTCSALIHHGGYGTMCAAAAANIPQIVAMDNYQGMEGPLSARFVTESGAGLVIRREAHSAADMQKRIDRVLTEPSFRQGAADIYRDLLATPGPHETVSVLEGLTAQYRRVV
ncbi:nucleotide disphospho-sugar-binding domain-containing protein [Streptomyces sp. NPDC056470]|uniref:nucleotide disphospho-sugar-binding domain-containing protein n=1 Tax=Streptomyces sp. NPDC056470 TaxID=3345831 RepID=UPI00369D37D6